jgi:PHP family Zn ribbon phosphoesterase
MKVHCARCHAEFDITEEQHYRDVVCPKCGNEFQAVTAATEQVGRDFLNEILRDAEKKPE